ncbi:MAG: PLP-dependent aminotransferase family protein [Caldilineales bacterium]
MLTGITSPPQPYLSNGNGRPRPDMALSAETSTLKRSVMRELLKLAARPDVISLAGGLPASDLLPQAELSECVEAVLRRDGARALQYSPMDEALRRWICESMRARGVACQPEQVHITNGAQQGLAILSRLFLDPGQPAVIEAVTFTGIQQVTAGRGAAVRTVPTDLSTGLDVAALEEAFRREPRPRLAVVIPDFHNPLGVSLTVEKRRRVAELAARYRVPVVEDDPYSALRFAGEPRPPVKAFDEAGAVLYVGSFSKMLAPALRLGWIVAPAALAAQITVLRESIDLESSTLIQRAVSLFVERGLMDGHLARFNAANRCRRDLLFDELDHYLGAAATWTQPEGGLFVWLTLAGDIDTWEMLDRAIAAGVAYVPGAAFAVDGGFRNTLRLNFSNVQPELIPVAVERLARVIGRAGK